MLDNLTEHSDDDIEVSFRKEYEQGSESYREIMVHNMHSAGDEYDDTESETNYYPESSSREEGRYFTEALIPNHRESGIVNGNAVN